MQLLPLGRFGAIEDSILLRNIPIVERDSRGRLYATVLGAEDHEIIVYEPSGEILRTVGRPGRGPGEFTRVWDLLVGPDDTLFVGHERMVSVFDSAGSLVRSVQLKPPRGILQQKFVGFYPGHSVLTAVTVSDSVRFPLHLYDDQGRYIRGFGPSGFRADHNARRDARASTLHATGYRITAYADGSIWLKGDGGYRFENVDMEGRVRRVIGVQGPPEWDIPLYMTRAEYEAAVRSNPSPAPAIRPAADQTHPGTPRPTERRPSVRPRSAVRDVTTTKHGLVVVIHVPATNWQNARVRLDTTRFTVQSVPDPGYREQLYDTVLDVIDVESGSVVARKRVPGMFQLTSDGSLYRSTVSQSGVISVEVFEVELASITPRN